MQIHTTTPAHLVVPIHGLANQAVLYVACWSVSPESMQETAARLQVHVGEVVLVSAYVNAHMLPSKKNPPQTVWLTMTPLECKILADLMDALAARETFPSMGRTRWAIKGRDPDDLLIDAEDLARELNSLVWGDDQT